MGVVMAGVFQNEPRKNKEMGGSLIVCAVVVTTLQLTLQSFLLHQSCIRKNRQGNGYRFLGNVTVVSSIDTYMIVLRLVWVLDQTTDVQHAQLLDT